MDKRWFGLFLLVHPNGSKAWQFRHQFLGREKLLSPGTYPILSLADARKKRDDAKAQLADGLDPSVRRKLDRIDAATKARITYKAVADEYYQTWKIAALRRPPRAKSAGMSVFRGFEQFGILIQWRVWFIWAGILGGCLAMQQAPLFDSVAFDPFSLL